MIIRKIRASACIVLFFPYIFFAQQLFAEQASPVLVDITWLSEHLNDKTVTLVDAREAEKYIQGHIPGAVNIPVEKTFSPVKPTNRVGNLKYIRTLFSNAGIRNGTTIVVYDDSLYIDAGRVFWVFEVYGHKDVKLLNGGFDGWVKSGHLISRETPAIQISDYIPAVEPTRLATRFSVELAMDDPNKLIIDARHEDEYLGKKSQASHFGHIPNAVNVPWDRNYELVDGVVMLKSDDELRQIYGNNENKKVYTYCNRGRHSSLTYVILRQLGYDVAHYDGSWLEWGNSSSLPVSRESRALP